MNEPKILVDETMLFFAFRYALGRKTYAVSWVAETIIANWDIISDKMKNAIKQEITDADSLGQSIDAAEWMKIIALV